jgi:tripartite-type tricarboxylate transporter receptor subunit TctC
MIRSNWKHGIALLALAWVLPGFAQQYPSKQIQVILPHAPGSSPDVVTRIVTQKLSARLGQPIVIDNRVGAGGAIGLGAAAKAPADGYTLVIGHVGSLTINPNIYANLPYTRKNFAPITQSVTTPLLVVVSANSSYKSMADLIAAAKANPGKLNFSSAGNGTASHMSGILFASMAGISIVHIPFKSAPAALTAVIADDVALTFGGQPPAWPLVKGNKLRALGLTSAARVAEFPDTPVLAETVKGYETLDWNGFMVPAGTPPNVIALLHRELVQILKDTETDKLLRGQGLLPVANTPAEFAAVIERETEKWARVAKDVKLTLD